MAPPPHAHHAAPSSRTAVPTWLLTVLFAFAFIGLGGGAYWVVHYFTGNRASATSTSDAVPAKATGKEHAMQKYIEVSGIRFVESPKKETEARFVIVNHSGADITDLGGTVNVWGRTNRSEEEAAGTFSFKLPSLGPNESKEATAPLKTKLKVYELPDWQNIALKPGVSVITCLDSVGGQQAKIAEYNQFDNLQRVQYPGYKDFYTADTPPLTPQQILALTPPPVMVAYQ